MNVIFRVILVCVHGSMVLCVVELEEIFYDFLRMTRDQVQESVCNSNYPHHMLYEMMSLRTSQERGVADPH